VNEKAKTWLPLEEDTDDYQLLTDVLSAAGALWAERSDPRRRRTSEVESKLSVLERAVKAAWSAGLVEDDGSFNLCLCCGADTDRDEPHFPHCPRGD